MTDNRPTIFALSSGRPPAAIAVVRISGPRAGEALKALGVKPIKPREAKFARLRDPQTSAIIDEAVVLWFPGPRSETGEDVAELQVHGGRAVVAAVLAALGKIEGLRPAEAGEFTRRAFENGKLDLIAVEGLADLVMAETEGQRAQALRQMQGALGRQAESWRARLIQALALVEAGIDFSDEADVPAELVDPALIIVRELEGEIETALADGGRGERLREGLVVAIAGPPNAGKSTLLNRIARREAAIVSPYAGTTRDVIEVHLDLGGLPVTLLDTAGIRETEDPVELEGVRRARARASLADLVLWVEDASAREGESGGEESTINGLSSGGSFAPVVWLVRNKIDLMNQSIIRNEYENLFFGGERLEQQVYEVLTDIVNEELTLKNEPKIRSNKPLKTIVNQSLIEKSESKITNIELEFSVSATSGVGFDELITALGQAAEKFLTGAESALITRARHRHALEETLAALRRALARPLAEREDLLAEELRFAAAALGRLIGRVDVEDVLDLIFRDFCIGK